MPVPCTADDFVALVVQSGLLDQAILAAHQKQLPPGSPPNELARMLVRANLLTQFQADQLLLGTARRFLIGKYKVLDRLGSGGMAQVYLGEHRTMKHKVAIKVLPPAKASDPAARDRFMREARATAALNHPNIVRAHDIDVDDGLHYIVMEYVEGHSLLEMVTRHGPMHPQQAVRYLRQAANGLQHAFEAGLVHRDIKPANLLVDRNGTLKILDLGLALFFADEMDNLSQKYNESVLGTADYLAPEQVDDSHNIDIRADIYSLGATFYFCLTGRPPFPEGSFTQKLIWHQTRHPRPMKELRPDLPSDLVTLIEKLMAKDPAERCQTPAEVTTAAAFIIAETGEPKTWETAILHADGTKKDAGPLTPIPHRSPTRPIPVLRNLKSEASHDRLRSGLLAAVVFLLLGLSLASVVLLWPGRTPESPTSERQAGAVQPPGPVQPAGPVCFLHLHCGRGKGTQEAETAQAGYSWDLLQGAPFDTWPASASRTYCWYDQQTLRFVLKVPVGRAMTLRMLMVDGDSGKRREKLTVQQRVIDVITDFDGPGKWIEVPVAAHEIPNGKIDVTIERLDGHNAVISEIEVLAPIPPRKG